MEDIEFWQTIEMSFKQQLEIRQVVVAQLEERLFPTPEVHSSNPAISKFIPMYYHLHWNKEKGVGVGLFFKKLRRVHIRLSMQLGTTCTNR